MKFLSATQFARITIQARQPTHFIVPVELAGLILLFLASETARLIALVTYCVARDLVLEYRHFIDYLAGWREDLLLIRLAILDLVGVIKVEGAEAPAARTQAYAT